MNITEYCDALNLDLIVLAVLDKHAETLLASDYPGAAEDYRATVEARAAIEQMAKDAGRYLLLCQHVDASIAYARRLYLHYHATGSEAVAKDFSLLVQSLERDRSIAVFQESAK